MNSSNLGSVNTLAFDIFGTVLDLSGSLITPIEVFLESNKAVIKSGLFWDQWRARQRIEQYQDNILMLGHSGYLETCRRALIYCLDMNKIEYSPEGVEVLMEEYQRLQAFPDAIQGLKKLSEKFQLVALSNGGQGYLEHLANNSIKIHFSEIISVELVGMFKPHPSVYRAAAQKLQLEPRQIMMVAAHSFDIIGARACGFRGAYVDRYDLPMGCTDYLPDISVPDFHQLALSLTG